MFKLLLVIILTACSSSPSNTKSAADAETSAAQASALQHQDARRELSVPVIINCVQIYGERGHVDVAPCLYREGSGAELR